MELRWLFTAAMAGQFDNIPLTAFNAPTGTGKSLLGCCGVVSRVSAFLWPKKDEAEMKETSFSNVAW